MTTTPRLDDVEQYLTRLGGHDMPDYLSGVHTRTMFIDGTLAGLLLEFNRKPAIGVPGSNRRQIPANIKALVQALCAAEWKYTHQGIAFDINGDLVDGQHRLRAIQLASGIHPDIRVPIQVTTGLPLGNNEAIDLGRRRANGTILQMKGHASGHGLNTILTLLLHYNNYDFQRTTLDRKHWQRIIGPQEAFDALDTFSPYIEDATKKGSFVRFQFRASAAGAGWVLCKMAYPDAPAEEFLHGIHSMTGFKHGDPRLLLTRWAMSHKDRKTPPAAYLAVYLKAFEAWQAGKSLDTLNFRLENERFPPLPGFPLKTAETDDADEGAGLPEQLYLGA